jgi:lipopolysaccharide/colanic/teichoic acid biosynthesis glycosyltransferase
MHAYTGREHMHERAAQTLSLRFLSDVPAALFANPLTVSDRARLLMSRLIAAALLMLLGPLMLACAWLIRTDGGPATFAHVRVGCRGRLFRCLKFRTMCPSAEQALQAVLERDPLLRMEWERNQKLADDPRVTRVGKWLRRASLDELPQLLNVIRGEMALVGPRPITVAELRRYGPARWQYLSVLPGITGLWQVSGRNRVAYERRIELDQLYVKNRSAWFDCKILAKTLLVVLTRDGAC